MPAQALALSQVYPGQLGTEACSGLMGVTSAQVARTSWNRVGSPDLFSVISILYCNIVDPQCSSAVLHQPDLVKCIIVPIFSPLVYHRGYYSVVSRVSCGISYILGDFVFFVCTYVWVCVYASEEMHTVFCHKGGVICISEVIDISPGNIDSSLCFFQPSISHNVLCI